MLSLGAKNDDEDVQLRYGDTITLADLEAGGFISCDAAAESLFVTPSRTFNPKVTGTDMQFCAFTITPKLKYSALENAQKEAARLAIEGVTLDNWRSLVDDEASWAGMEHEERKVQVEQDTNNDIMARSLGRPVVYGSSVQLKHAWSGRFLSQSRSLAEHGVLSFQISLVDGGDKRSRWRIVSSGKGRAVGEHVVYSDKIRIENAKFTNTFLSVKLDDEAPTKKEPSPHLMPDRRGSQGRKQAKGAASSAYKEKGDTSAVSDVRLEIPISLSAHGVVQASSDYGEFMVQPFRLYKDDIIIKQREKGKEAIGGEEDGVTRVIKGHDIVALYRAKDDAYLGVNTAGKVTWLPISDAVCNGNIVPQALWALRPRNAHLAGRVLPLEAKGMLLRHLPTAMFLTASKDKLTVQQRLLHTGTGWMYTAKAQDDELKELRDHCLMSLSTDTDVPHYVVRKHSRRSGTLIDQNRQDEAVLQTTPEEGGQIEIQSMPFADSMIHFRVLWTKKILLETLPDLSAPVTMGGRSTSGFQLQQTSSFRTLGRMPSLHEQDESREWGDDEHVTPALWNTVIDAERALTPALNYMTALCSGSSAAKTVTKAQDLLRLMGLLDLLFDALRSFSQCITYSVPGRESDNRQRAAAEVCKMMYVLIERACQGNGTNKRALLPYVNVMQSHLRLNIRSYAALVALYSGSAHLLESLDEAIFFSQIESLRNRKSRRILGLIMQTCNSNGIPISQNQNMWARKILVEAPELLLRVDVTEDDVILKDNVWMEGDSHEGGISVVALASRGDEALTKKLEENKQEHDTTSAMQLFDYYLCTLELIPHLVHGRNIFALEQLMQKAERLGVSYSSLVSIAQRDNLPCILRARALSVLRALYIDVDPYTPIPPVVKMRLWARLVDPSKATGGASWVRPDDINQRVLKELLSAEIRNCDTSNVERDSKGHFALQLVLCVSQMMKLGFYHQKVDHNMLVPNLEQLRQVAAPLVDMLDGRFDQCRPVSGFKDDHARFVPSPKNDIVVQRNDVIMRIFEFMLDCTLDAGISQVVAFWGKITDSWLLQGQEIGDVHRSSEPDSNASAIIRPSMPLDNIFTYNEASMEEYKSNPQLWGQTSPWNPEALSKFVDSLFVGSAILPELAPSELRKQALPRMVCVLLDQARFQNVTVKERSMCLLLRLYSQWNDLHAAVTKVWIASTPSSAHIGMQLRLEHREMESLKLIILREFSRTTKKGQSNEYRERAFARCTDIVLGWTKYCSVTKDARDLREIQGIMHEVGAVDQALQLLNVPLNRSREKGTRLCEAEAVRLKMLFNAIYKFLAAACLGNHTIQMKLLSHENVYLGHMGVRGLNVEQLLRCIAGNNITVLVKQGPAWIAKVVVYLYKEYNTLVPRWLHLLSALVTCNGVPVKENQSAVNSFLHSNKGRDIMLMESDSDWEYRINLLCEVSPARVDSESPTLRPQSPSRSMSPPPTDSPKISTIDQKSQSHSPAHHHHTLKPIEPYTFEDDVLARHLASVDLLTALSTGRSSAGKFYAASFLSLADVVRNIVAHDYDSQGHPVTIRSANSFKLRRSFVAFMHQVYVQVQSEASQTLTSALFTGPRPPPDVKWGKPPPPPLIKVLLNDLQALGNAFRGRGDVNHALDAYVYGDVLPLLHTFFQLQGFADFVTEPRRAMLEGVFDEVLELHSLSEGVSETCFLPVQLQHVNRQAATRTVLIALSRDLGVREDWYQSQVTHSTVQKWVKEESGDSRAGSSGEGNPPLMPNPSMPSARMGSMRASSTRVTPFPSSQVFHAASQAQQKVYDAGFTSLCKAIGPPMKAKDASAHLCELLGREGEAAIYGGGDEAKASGMIISVRYSDVLTDILGLVKTCSFSNPTIVRTLIDRFRMALYMSACKATADNCDQAAALLEDERPIEAESTQRLERLQARFDAVGLTIACVRAFTVNEHALQKCALRCLLALLQRGNSRVKDTLGIFLSSPKRANIFMSLREAIVEGVSLIKAYKKLLRRKQEKDEDHVEDSLTAHARGDSLEDFAEQFFGRKSRLTMTLRLLQLMCSGQCKSNQDLMVQQDRCPKSSNLLLACTDVIVAAQPLLADSLIENEGHLSVCFLQCCSTVQESFGGMHSANLKEVLSGDALSAVNRLMSSMNYMAISKDKMQNLEGMDVSANDMRSYLKAAALKLTLAMFEAVYDLEDQGKVSDVVDHEIVLRNIRETANIIGWSTLEKRKKVTDAISKIVVGAGKQANRLKRTATDTFRLAVAPLLPDEWLRGKDPMLETKAKYNFSEGFKETLRQELLACFRLLLNCADFDQKGIYAKALTELKAEDEHLAKQLWNQTSTVEVAHKNGKDVLVEKVYFPISDHVGVVESPQFRSRFKDMILSLPRDNAQEKGRHFVRNLRHMLRRLEWLEMCYDSPFTGGLMRITPKLNNYRFFLAIIITFLLVFFYGIPMDPNTGGIVANGQYYGITKRPGYRDRPYPFANSTSDPTGNGKMFSTVMREQDLSIKYRLSLMSRWDNHEDWRFYPNIKIIIYVLGCLHVILSMLKGISFLILDFPLIWFESHDEARDAREKAKKDKALAQEPVLQNKVKEDGEDGDSPSVSKTLDARSRQFLDSDDSKEDADAVEDKERYIFDKKFAIIYVKKSINAGYFACVVAFSWLGLLRSPFFYACLMLEYFRMADGRNVTRAVVRGIPNLARSFLIGMMVVVCFGFYSYSYFSQTAIIEDETCHSLFQCVAKHITDSFRGDITTVVGTFATWTFPALVVWQDSWYAWRTVYLLSTLIFWSLLLQPVMNAQIIEAFAALRSQTSKALEDVNDRCFISGLDRFEFHNYPGEWEMRSGGKYAWNYMLYLRYLKNMDEQEMNGMEKYAADLFDKGRSRFLPVGMFAARKRDDMRQEEDRDEWQDGINKFVAEVKKELALWREVSGEGGSKLADMMASVAKIEEKVLDAVPSIRGTSSVASNE